MIAKYHDVDVTAKRWNLRKGKLRKYSEDYV